MSVARLGTARDEKMSEQLSAAQAVLDREQTAFLGDAPSRAQLSAWFNACLNSACGPIKHRYGDAAVVALLETWAEVARGKGTAVAM